MKEKTPLDKLKDDVHYLIIAHCKYKDMLMYDRALKQFQEDINYGQLEEMSYDERFAFLLGFETSLKATENTITLNEQLKESPDMIESFSNLLPKPEDTWEMKCHYKVGDEHYGIQSSGDVFLDCWRDIEADNRYFSQGNIFPTEQAALLEANRRNLLTRFRAFRDECNGDWKADFKNKTAKNEAKWNISYYNGKLQAACTNTFNDFVVFGYFKKKRGALRAIKLFGDEIKELFVEGE